MMTKSKKENNISNTLNTRTLKECESSKSSFCSVRFYNYREDSTPLQRL